MEPQPDRPDRPDPRGLLTYLGGAWVWIFVGLLAVSALTVRWLVQPQKSSTTATAVTTTASTTTTTTTPPTTAAPSSPPPPETVADAPTLSGVWTMPDEVGRTFADAKRDIVELTDGAVDDVVEVSDASGRGRRQIVHENWKVCTQTPDPGAKFTPESGVAFTVVKHGETCPEESAVTHGASVAPAGD